MHLLPHFIKENVSKGGPVEEALILNIQQNLNFPAQNWESGFCFGFCNEENWVPHYKTLAQPTPSDSKTEKVNTEWQEKKIQNLLYVEN